VSERENDERSDREIKRVRRAEHVTVRHLRVARPALPQRFGPDLGNPAQGPVMGVKFVPHVVDPGVFPAHS
jgi:hypothetical protein